MNFSTRDIDRETLSVFSHYAEQFGRPMRVDAFEFEDGIYGFLVYVPPSNALPPDETYKNFRIRFRPAVQAVFL